MNIRKPLKKRCLALAAAATLFAFGDASAVVYLKPLADGETRATQDGASWATAYTDATAAIAAAQDDADATLYAAAGVYVVPAQITLAKSLAIYGGFSGADGETLESRDISANETIFSGDVNGNDVWVHYEFDASKLVDVWDGYKPVMTVTTLSDKVVTNGKCAYPAYTGDYDSYAPPSSKNNTATDNTAAFLTCAKTVTSFRLSGVTLTGFYSDGLLGNVLNFLNVPSTGSVTLTDCRLVGNASGEAAIWQGSVPLTATRLTFACNYAHRNAGFNLGGETTISDCTFESLYGGGAIRANAIFVHNNNTPTTIERCTFARLGRVNYINYNYGGPAVVMGGEQNGGVKTVRDCVVRNCFSVCTDPGRATEATPIVSPNHGNWRFEKCRFSQNYSASRPKTDGVYTLFGCQRDVASGGSLWLDCVFDGNVHETFYSAAAAGGAYAIGICGSASGGSGAPKKEMTYVNCVFDRNEVREKTPTGADITRADIVSASANGYAMRASVVNCTFRQKGDDAGFAAVARYGTAHLSPLNVVNCLVMSDASVATPFAAPAELDETNGILAWNVTAQNVLSAPSCVAQATGWNSDATPLATATDTGALTPTVRTPGIRASADVASCETASLPEFRFKPADAWLPLNVASASAGEATLIGDLVSPSAARPSGAFTRGAVQALSDAAENGKALVVRCEPLKGGTLTGPSAQAVADGAAATSVTAVPADGVTFGGWYDATTGEQISGETTLALASVAADRVVVAKFLTGQVTITFDLGTGGTFTENGQSTIALTKSVGDVFPAVPAYTASADWTILGFAPAMPDYVPGASATYAAELLTTAVRVFHIVPSGEVPEGSDKTGSSWANATDDIDAAIRDAARYRGELWLKEGVYVVPTTAYPLLSNVGVYGGFAGTEASRDAADPKTHVTVLTGDVNRDDYWMPNGADPAEADRQLVFDYATKTFLPPVEAEGTHSFAAGKGTTRAYAFSTTGYGMATNAVFSGLVLVRLSSCALRCDSDSQGSQLTVEDCAFYACGSQSQEYGCIECAGAVTAKNCSFVYCTGGISATECALGGPSLVANCTFDGNRVYTRDLLLLKNTVSPSVVSNCTFRRNRQTYESCYLVNFRYALGSTLEDSRFEGNRFHLMPLSSSKSTASRGLLCLPDAKVLRCAFVGNTNETLAASGNYAALFQLNGGDGMRVRDSYFAQNAMIVTNASSTANAASIVVADNRPITFLNCTFTDNVAKSTASGYACTATQGGTGNGGVAAVNCVFANSVIEGGAGSAELVRATAAPASAYRSIAAINCVLYNTAADYLPVRKKDQMSQFVISSYLSNVQADGSDCDFTGSYGKYSVWRNVVTEGNPGLREVKKDKATGVTALGVSPSSPLAKTGIPVYLASDGQLYFYDDESAISQTKPWRRVTYPIDMYASVAGLTVGEGLVPDAFGQPRTADRVAAGPLNSPVPGFLMIIR